MKVNLEYGAPESLRRVRTACQDCRPQGLSRFRRKKTKATRRADPLQTDARQLFEDHHRIRGGASVTTSLCRHLLKLFFGCDFIDGRGRK
jgi:hypothetical protein